MEPLTEPALPIPLPRPLSDPLRRYRRFLLFILPPLWVAVVVSWLLPDVRKVREAAARTHSQNNWKQIADALDGGHREAAAHNESQNNLEQRARATDPGANVLAARAPSQNNPERTWTLRDTAAWAAFAASFTLLLCTFCILPRRATNALYLRSFRNDAETGRLRIVAQAALGRAFRLSGIRDPRRRWPALIRHLFYILFLIRYAQPNFMNLEAGRDWKARLWRSLSEARCALIDVTALTPFVREEIVLAIGCLGLHRVLFIGNDSRTVDEWRQAVLTALGSPDVLPECLRVAIWTATSEGQASFKDQVRAFAAGLPADPPGLIPAVFPQTGSTTDPDGHAVTGESWRTFLLANLIGVGIAGVFLGAENRLPAAGLAWFLPGVIYDVLVFLLLLQYLAMCDSLRERLRIGAVFLLGAVFAGLPVLLSFTAAIKERGRDAAARRETFNLKRIARAADQDKEDHQPLPPWAGCRTDGTPLPSWLLLPYIEQDNLFRSGMDEGGAPFSAWNGSVSGTPVKTYLCPVDNGYSPQGSPLMPASFPDGTSNTISLAERYPTSSELTSPNPYALNGGGTVWGERTPPDWRPQPSFSPWRWSGTTGVAAFDPPFRLEEWRRNGEWCGDW